MYRVNYGNGQVSPTYRRRTHAQRHLREQAMQSAFMFIEYYMAGSADDPGEWVRVVA